MVLLIQYDFLKWEQWQDLNLRPPCRYDMNATSIPRLEHKALYPAELHRYTRFKAAVEQLFHPLPFEQAR